MDDVLRKRVIGAAILILIGVMLPVVLSRCVQDPVAESQAMRVYEVTPSGDIEALSGQLEPVAPNAAEQSAPPPAPVNVPATDKPVTPPQEETEAQTTETEADASKPVVEAKQTPDAVESAPEEQSAAPSGSSGSTDLEKTVATDSWVVQVASFAKESNAKALAAQLDAGYPVFYTAAQVNGDTWYRVRVGPFDSDAAADNAAAELRAQGRNTLVVHVD